MPATSPVFCGVTLMVTVCPGLTVVGVIDNWLTLKVAGFGFVGVDVAAVVVVVDAVVVVVVVNGVVVVVVVMVVVVGAASGGITSPFIKKLKEKMAMSVWKSIPTWRMTSEAHWRKPTGCGLP